MTTAYTLGQIQTINEMEMHYKISGEGTPLVLLHGFTGSGADWDLIFPESPKGYQLIVPDLRGHGRSTNPSGTFTFKQSALDVFALLDHLGISQFNAIGASAGAKTLLHMATQQRNRIRAMVLVSAANYFPEQARIIMSQMSPENRTEAEWTAMRQRHKHGDDQIRTLWQLGHAFKDSYEDMNFTPPLLSSISAWTLIVHGDRDPLYPIEIPFNMYNAIPNAYLWIVPNSGHSPIWGEVSTRFVETAINFLDGKWEAAVSD